MFFQARRVHFIGIGGSGMSGIAEVLLNLQYEVSGSDWKLSAVTQRLEQLGARIWEGHDPKHVQGAEAVVTSSAVKADNPEVLEAKRLQIPVIPRGEMLAELMRLKFGIAIAGSHGKTTTTSMVAAVLGAAGMDPTFVVGGRVNSLGSNAKRGKGDFMVVEADESDRSFLHLAPIVAVITNIDREHMDCYGTLEELRRAYAEFANKVPFYGACILCAEDENIRTILPQLRRRVVTYGAESVADLMAREISCGHMQSRFRLQHRGEDLGWFHMRVPGRHNVMNAMAAVAVGLELKIQPEKIREALAGFGGVERRFQVRGEVEGITVVDDYGHHPAEIRATLRAAADCEYKRVIVVFQPHRYSRTSLLLDDFARCFVPCDHVLVMDIYAAGEAPLEGITSKTLTDRMEATSFSAVEHQPTADAVVRRLLEITRPGDLVLTQGAGSVWQVGEQFLEALRQRSRSAVKAGSGKA
ncbi:MAG: UDP-N-acetylmuramate--L-alanine ligase [Acidobacteria bacterium RIFCSPLOWO2_12_FULL_54_10]|nr:MAG: UDP-N-acetylmuramate--L-alanine ligase [Acidobacteria bacterium RIFCSPLOWO2_12_FULL_54_10]